MTRRVVILESPYAGTPDACRYLACCMLDSINRGEAPIASHALYPLALPEHVSYGDGVATGREVGLECGAAWEQLIQLPDKVAMEGGDVPWIHHVWYVDLGYSAGMQSALDRYLVRVPQQERAEVLARSLRCLQHVAREIWERGDWPSQARLIPNH